ncbi:hypothetical protein D3C72_1802980 [compost metagenome]
MLLPLGDQPLHAHLAKQLLDVVDKLQRQLAVAIGEALPGLLGQVPEPYRSTAAPRLVAKTYPAVGLQRRQMLTGAHGGHLQLLPQRGGTLGAVSLKQVEDLVGTGVHGVDLVIDRRSLRESQGGNGVDRVIMGSSLI